MSKGTGHISLGQRGEDIACAYLVDKGYRILQQNARRKWGEIDIVCIVPRGTMAKVRQKNVPRGTLRELLKRSVLRGTLTDEKGGGKLVFIEVKTMREGVLRPEENVTRVKQKKLIRTCQLYLTEKGYTLDSEWQIDVVAVVVDSLDKVKDIRHIENAVY